MRVASQGYVHRMRFAGSVQQQLFYAKERYQALCSVVLRCDMISYVHIEFILSGVFGVLCEQSLCLGQQSTDVEAMCFSFV